MLANSGDPDQTPRYVASDLGLHCLPMSNEKDAMLVWVNEMIFSQFFCHLKFNRPYSVVAVVKRNIVAFTESKSCETDFPVIIVITA